MARFCILHSNRSNDGYRQTLMVIVCDTMPTGNPGEGIQRIHSKTFRMAFFKKQKTSSSNTYKSIEKENSTEKENPSRK